MVVAESVRVAAAAAGVFVMLAVVLITLAVVHSCAAPTSEEPGTSALLAHLSLLYKGTYVIYGNGRRSERDLPVCSNPGEACNLAHERFWLTPITERLCRCPGRLECPLHFNGINDTFSQHVSNRAQLKFCGDEVEELNECRPGDLALRVRHQERHDPAFPLDDSEIDTHTINDMHSELQCRCPWPNHWTLAETRIPSPTETIFFYTCDELPQCRAGDKCGQIRADTLESYYSCSCPERHLCLFRGPQPTHTTTQLHFTGHAYTAKCTPN